ncbi:MAG: hypothetical protein C0456_12745 [Hyphomonas sp.]|uniref:hypothetical protein n=1 Tax=Hyphomonas sp. TaxID=87 RepID=UPI001DA63D10|nr:hypothetical protein [Hyphomonas sp.]MBA4227491.1 hypothetical protein [Hyphomonas sp.]
MLEELIKVLPLLATILAGFFAFMKWLDVRQREIADKEFERVSRLVMIITGQYPDGSKARTVDQILAVWMLKEYPRYHDAIRRALQRDWDPSWVSENFVRQIVPEINAMLSQLEKRK